MWFLFASFAIIKFLFKVALRLFFFFPFFLSFFFVPPPRFTSANLINVGAEFGLDRLRWMLKNSKKKNKKQKNNSLESLVYGKA